eukprot:scaffold65069_cov17-Tisochrysis_lutea.AAC.2
MSGLRQCERALSDRAAVLAGHGRRDEPLNTCAHTNKHANDAVTSLVHGRPALAAGTHTHLAKLAEQILEVVPLRGPRQVAAVQLDGCTASRGGGLVGLSGPQRHSKWSLHSRHGWEKPGGCRSYEPRCLTHGQHRRREQRVLPKAVYRAAGMLGYRAGTNARVCAWPVLAFNASLCLNLTCRTVEGHLLLTEHSLAGRLDVAVSNSLFKQGKGVLRRTLQKWQSIE